VDKAVYAYAIEDYAWWASTMPATSFGPGLFGENLTTEGAALGRAIVGERWQIGSVVLEVRQPRFPCYKLGMRMGDAGFKDTFDQARRSGTYFSVTTPGTLAAGDPIVRLSRPDHDITIDDLVAIVHDADTPLLTRILAVPAVPQGLLTAATRRLTSLQDPTS
jgi:MOSC domain-containing protein YiiM